LGQSHIVLQTFWRSQGTYFWSKLRNDIRNRAYYEPLHEELITKTPETWEKLHRSGITRILRHPDLDRHYATEYPLRQCGGMRNFTSRLCYDRFLLAAEDEDEGLERYLLGLVSYAEAFGQRACFKFVRGGLRAGFIRRVLGGQHIYINRSPAGIAASHGSFGRANYFARTLMEILAKNTENAFCAGVIEGVRQHGQLEASSLRRIAQGEGQMAEAVTIDLNLQQRDLLTTAFWLAYLLEGLAACDLVIDTERLEANEVYRRQIGAKTQSLFEAGGFKDFRPSRQSCDYAPPAALRQVVGVSERLQALARSIPGDAISSLGEGSRRVLDAVL